MAFLNKIKSVFGFSNEDYEMEENELLQRDATVTPLSHRRQNSSLQEHSDLSEVNDDINIPEEQNSQDNQGCPEEIFKKVVEIFNDALPSFIGDCLDKEKQAKYIHDALDESMKAYIAQLDHNANARMKVRLDYEQQSLRREIDSLRDKAKRIEDTSAEWQEQKLSAERQKRALSERVHDLEKQIASFLAEKEQYELENKSLVNKLRAMSIQDGDMETLRNDNEALRQEVKALRENASPTIVPAVDHETLKRLDELNDSVDDLSAQKEALIRERNNLANDIVVLKKKCEISDAMLNDLNQKASSAKIALNEKEVQYKELLSKYEQLILDNEANTTAEQQLNDLKAEARQKEAELLMAKENIESVNAELQRVNSELHNESVKVQQLTDELRQAKEALSQSDSVNNISEDEIAKNAQIEQLQNELVVAKSELKEAKEEVDACRSSLTAFEESLIKIEQINESRQNKIIDLQQQLKDSEDTLDLTTKRVTEQNALIAKRESEISTLKSTIDRNLKLQAESEALLRKEIEQLRKSNESLPRQRRKKVTEITSIDESLDDTNWLVSTPPEGTNARPGGVSDSEFGYQAPQHREEPNNPAQMSLW